MGQRWLAGKKMALENYVNFLMMNYRQADVEEVFALSCYE